MLLPSNELARLADRVDICLSGKTEPKGCDIRYRQLYWLIVFDAKSELRSACRLSDKFTEFTKQGLSLPSAFVAIVDEALAATVSLEQLERNYVKQRGSSAAFDALRAKLAEIDGVGQMRVAKFLAESASATEDPVLSRARGLMVEADAVSHQVINHGAFAKLRTGLEALLASYPGHAASADIVDLLVDVGLRYSFDVQAICRQHAATWSSRRVESADYEKLAQLLRDACAAAVARDEEQLRGMKPKAYGRLRLQARLGDAVATLQGLDAGKSFGVMRPIHAEWRAAATAKQASGTSRRN